MRYGEVGLWRVEFNLDVYFNTLSWVFTFWLIFGFWAKNRFRRFWPIQRFYVKIIKMFRHLLCSGMLCLSLLSWWLQLEYLLSQSLFFRFRILFSIICTPWSTPWLLKNFYILGFILRWKIVSFSRAFKMWRQIIKNERKQCKSEITMVNSQEKFFIVGHIFLLETFNVSQCKQCIDLEY